MIIRPVGAFRALLLAGFFLAGHVALAEPKTAAQAAPPEASGAEVDTSEGYTGSAACITCHAQAADAWETSHHALAWTDATSENILADFNDAEFAHAGMSATFSIDGDGTHRITVTEKDGTTRDYPVHSVAGIEPLQQYLLETEPGRLQSFDIVWDTEKKRWFHLYPDADLPPKDGLHWTGPYKNWNGRCAVCHATGYEKNYDPATKRFDSTEVEIGVGCEACHGPGKAHVDWAEGGAPSHPANYGFPVDLAGGTPQIETCAGCHSLREPHETGSVEAGTPFDEAYNLVLLNPGAYHPDGQILGEVYVYGSFLQSKMHEKGVVCTDCHDPHTTRLKAEGNAVCTQCHSPAGNDRFPSLPLAEFDSPAHHFHEPGSPGAECKNCHMVEQVYMGNDWRADHSFRVPRPDLTEITGAPDACTTCHTDRDAAWAAAVLEERFPESTHRGPHFGTTFAAAQISAEAEAEALLAIAEGDGAPIVRASALRLMPLAGDEATADRVAALLADPDPLVRAAATSPLRSLPPAERLQALHATLTDPARNVRISAARALVDAQPAVATKASEPLAAASREWQASLAARADYPETQLQIGGIALSLRSWEAAEQAFSEAVAADPQLTDAWSVLVRLSAATGDKAKAQHYLAQALTANPDNAHLRQLQVELGRQ